MSQQEHNEKVDRDRVARRAGVSTATVSRVFNRPDTVSAQKREQVIRAAAELGYEPNKFASALARKSSGKILWIDGRKLSSHDPVHSAFYAGLYTESMGAAVNIMERSPYHLTIAQEYGQTLRAGDFDGIIVYDIDSQQQLERLQNKGIPIIIGHHVQHFSHGLRFAVDNVAAGGILGTHLRNAGHENVAFVSGQTGEISSHMDRKTGFQQIFTSFSVQELEVPIGPAGGRLAAQRLIPEIRAGNISAVAVVNDLTAFGLVQALLASGISIPLDVSIVACDNLPILDLLPVRISSLDLGLANLYARATELLLRSISAAEMPHDSLQLFQPKLVHGESVSTPR